MLTLLKNLTTLISTFKEFIVTAFGKESIQSNSFPCKIKLNN